MSDFFQWDPSKLGLNVPEMDREHEILVSHMNRLYVLSQKGAKAEALSRAFDELVSYTARHFADEEAYMERIGFPGLRVHKGVHKQLMDRMLGLRQTVRSTGKLPDDLFVFFKMWLSAHISGVDAKYAKYANTSAAANG